MISVCENCEQVNLDFARDGETYSGTSGHSKEFTFTCDAKKFGWVLTRESGNCCWPCDPDTHICPAPSKCVPPERIPPGVVTEVQRHCTDDCNAGSPPLSTVIVMDDSGSMREGSRMSDLKAAARKLINRLSQANAEIGLVRFDGKASVLHDMSRNYGSMLNSLNDLDVGGNTKYKKALKLALKELDDGQPSQSYRRSVIFISDGSPSDSGYDEKAREIRSSAKLYTVFIGGNASVMRDLASSQGYSSASQSNPRAMNFLLKDVIGSDICARARNYTRAQILANCETLACDF